MIALDYFQLLAKSKINLNNHIDCAEGYAGNIRLFEATGMGACLMTDWMINLPEMFEDGVEIVAYRNAGECVEKVNYLLEHPQELAAIAAAGQRRTLRDHTYVNRAQQLDEIYFNHFQIKKILWGTAIISPMTTPRQLLRNTLHQMGIVNVRGHLSFIKRRGIVSTVRSFLTKVSPIELFEDEAITLYEE